MPDVTRVPALGKLLHPSLAASDQPAPSWHPRPALHASCRSSAEVTAHSGTHKGSRTASRSDTETPLNGEFTPLVQYSKPAGSTDAPGRSSIRKASVHARGRLFGPCCGLEGNHTTGRSCVTAPVAWMGKQAATCHAAAKRTLKPSPGHEPSLPEKPQPCHRKTQGLQRPGRSEVTLPHRPHLPVMGFCHL